MQGLIKKVKISDSLTVEVRELTVDQIRSWQARAESVPDDPASIEPDLIGEELFEEFTFDEIIYMSDINESDLNALPPSAITKLIDAAKEVNKHFFEMRRRMLKVGLSALPLVYKDSKSSSAN
jgi:hypothetical protein